LSGLKGLVATGCKESSDVAAWHEPDQLLAAFGSLALAGIPVMAWLKKKAYCFSDHRFLFRLQSSAR